jgi:hypothetical protein
MKVKILNCTQKGIFKLKFKKHPDLNPSPQLRRVSMQVYASAWFSFSTLMIAGGTLLAAPPISANTLNQWEEIAPGGDTICARGAPFSFFVRSGDPSSHAHFV